MTSFGRIAVAPALARGSAPSAAPGITYTGSPGDNYQVGTDNDDVFNYGQGGEDTIFGGAGDDQINLGARFTTDDRINGGTGYDILRLKGDYYANQLDLGPDTLFAVEEIRLLGGFDYVLTLDESTVAPGESLTIDATAVAAGDISWIFAGEDTDGLFVYKGGAGFDWVNVGQANATMFGGAGDDSLDMAPDFTGASRFDGGQGNDRFSVYFSASATVTLTAQTVVHVEQFSVLARPNAGDVTVHLIMSNGNVAAGETMRLSSGSSIGATLALFFDASAERDGAYEMYDNTRNDTLIGGRGDDVFRFFGGGTDSAAGGAGDDRFVISQSAVLDVTDTLDGGGGHDILQFAWDQSAGVVLGATSLIRIEAVLFDPNFSYAVTLEDAAVAAGGKLTADGSAIVDSHWLSFDGSAERDAELAIEGGAGADTLLGGRRDDVLRGGGGDDILSGGRGGDRLFGGGEADTFRYLSVTDSRASNPDTIVGFGLGADIIDLRKIDADITQADNQAFHLGKTTGHIGDIVVVYDAAADVTKVRLYVDADDQADGVILLEGDHRGLSADAFLL
ncbi:MAG TPA: calcium-binding protein [Caulobacteraceae bacterium]|jgi:Ca2+-binding RTX toxin-like protein